MCRKWARPVFTRMRDEFVANGVAFLQHPSVATVSYEHRAAFLREKGLTDEEIADAFRRINVPVPALTNVRLSPVPAPEPASSSSWFTTLLQWALAAGVGASAYHVLAPPASAAPTPALPPSDAGLEEELDVLGRLEESNR